MESCSVAKLVNIPDIYCVSRLVFDDLCLTAARPDLFRGSLNQFCAKNDLMIVSYAELVGSGDGFMTCKLRKLTQGSDGGGNG